MASRHADKRRFGRRRALIHAFVITAKGLRVPCLVRNISVGGALIEVELPGLMPRQLTLAIDVDGFTADCEVRHRTKHALGVNFSSIRIDADGRDTRMAGPQLSPEMQCVTITDLARR